MAYVKELLNKGKSFEILFEVSKKEIGDKLNVLEEFVVYSKKLFNLSSRIVKRGRTEATSYLLLPKEIKEKLKYKKKNASCKISLINNKSFLVELE